MVLRKSVHFTLISILPVRFYSDDASFVLEEQNAQLQTQVKMNMGL